MFDQFSDEFRVVASDFMAGERVTQRLTKTDKLLNNNRNEFFSQLSDQCASAINISISSISNTVQVGITAPHRKVGGNDLQK